MRKSLVFESLFRFGVAILASVLFVAISGTAEAGDREDAKALVGKWKYQGFLGDNFELLASGTKKINGFKLEWAVKGGKLVEYNVLGKPTEHSYTLSPDGKTLKYNGNTYKRQ